MSKLTYAVVDLETTGTNQEEDHIIQIGIALVREGKIIQTYATDLNPGKKILPIIEELTGITNARVKNAPYFEDVADTIYALLKDTVFVAHNIHFDFHFLNAEFRRAGMTEIVNAGIDTVELAQIFLPLEASYKLSELAKSLKVVHDNPHQADSDAFVTAHLLLEIERRIAATPLATLQQIIALSDVLIADNKQFLSNRAQRRKLDEAQSLPNHLIEVDGLIIRKPEEIVAMKEVSASNYPKTKKQKMVMFGEKLDYREEQARYMNMVYSHFSDENTEKNLFVEATTGIGKTLGYLLPLAFLATKEEKAIIATPSILLQNQLIAKDLPLAQSILQQEIRATLVKSAKHYIDLSRFKSSLVSSPKQKQHRIYQMATLIWLSQTLTGDFEELNYVNYRHPFFEAVRHRGLKYLTPFSPFYSVDFLRRVEEKMEASNILIVNQAFLAQETLREDFALPQGKYLLIDEAHHLPNALSRVTREKIELNGFLRKVRYFAEKENYETIFSLIKDSNLKQKINLLKLCAQDSAENLQTFVWKIEEIIHNRAMEELFMEEKNLKSLLPIYKKLGKNMDDLSQIAQEIEQYVLINQVAFSALEKFYLQNIFDFGTQLIKTHETLENFMHSWTKNLVKWLFANPRYQSIAIYVQDFDKNLIESSKWYQRFDKIIYTSGTLKIGKNKKFLPLSLGVDDYQLKAIPQSFDYKNQARIFLAEDFGVSGDEDTQEMAKKLAQAVLSLSKNVDESMLFLFTSHELLAKTRELVLQKIEERGRVLLAQNFNGSRNRILKNFQSTKGAVLFGADSFWEGIDLAGDTLRIIIVTRLPFENPKRPMVRHYYDYLKSRNISPFSAISMPKAGLRLRQGLGRLIRSKDDKGVMIILDQRIYSKNYGNRLLNVFPKEIPVKKAKLSEILTQSKDFLL